MFWEQKYCWAGTKAFVNKLKFEYKDICAKLINIREQVGV